MNIDNEELADKLVNKSLSIGRKKNPNIEKAKEKYGEEIIQKIKEKPNSLNEDTLEELSKPEYGPLIHEENGEKELKKEVGHTVVIKHHQKNRELAREIERKCLENGAHPILITENAERAKEKHTIPPKDSLKELTELSKSMASEPDYTISIDPIENRTWKEKIPKERIAITAPVKQRINEIREENKVKWSYVGWPHPEIAEDLGITHEKFKKILEETLKESFKPKMKKITQKWHEKLQGKKQIKIESEEGTDLTIGIEGRHILKDDGILTQEDIDKGDIGMNFPCGEVFTAPKENKADGKIFIPKTAVSSYGTVEDLWLEFEEGEIIDYSAEKNQEYLDRFFKENKGNIKTIAELGIGCNEKAEYTEGYILIDEKIKGTIHLAVGWNIGFGGENKASSHHDFIKPMQKGKLYADGELLMKNGEPTFRIED